MTTRRPTAPELGLIDLRPMTRSAFLIKGALAAGTAYGAAAVAPWVGTALAQNEGAGDIEILNFALTLEHLEALYYERALRQVSLSSETRTLVREIAGNEREHVNFLIGAVKTLGGKPAKEPEVSFPFSGEEAFLELAQTFEDTGVTAYNGAAPLIESKAVLNNAGRIVQVEGRHAGAIRFVRGRNPAEAALDGTLEFQEVVETVKPFLRTLPFEFRNPDGTRGALQGDSSSF
ncbi:MAG: ferritin-like domain-containing protein [Thermoleophilaceae bacterium]